MARNYYEGREEIVHSVRGAPRYGLKIKTRCGITVERIGALRTNYRTPKGVEVRAVPPDSVRKPTCNRCRQLLRMPMLGFAGKMEAERERIKSQLEKAQ